MTTFNNGKLSICSVCIAHNLPLRALHGGVVYCNLDQGLGVLEGIYRIPTKDNDEYNFFCVYKRQSTHSNIFK